MRTFKMLALLFAALYGGFGVQSPFLSPLLSARGLDAQTIGFVGGAGTLLRLLATPPLARWADQRRAVRLALAAACAGASLVSLAYLAPVSGGLLVVAALAQAIVLAPLAPFADAIALSAAARENFAYGWLRGTGSAVFVIGLLTAGALADRFGWGALALAQSLLLALAVPLALRAPEPTERAEPVAAARATWSTLVKIPAFRTAAAIAALVLGSHALHDGFAAIYWGANGISPRVVGVLWAEGVIAEVFVFFLAGPFLLDRIGVRLCMMIAIGAAIVRWSVMAWTAEASVMAFSEPLHGLSFALLHLSCMRLIAREVPAALAASAQSLYGSVAIGGAGVLLSVLSGVIYAHLSGGGFWFMAALAAVAIPLVFRLDAGRRDADA